MGKKQKILKIIFIVWSIAVAGILLFWRFAYYFLQELIGLDLVRILLVLTLYFILLYPIIGNIAFFNMPNKKGGEAYKSPHVKHYFSKADKEKVYTYQGKTYNYTTMTNHHSVKNQARRNVVFAKCPECGIEVEAGQKFCINCGYKLKE